ncbi:MAG TPA: LptA/OstA family protein [Steroidobacteraceae bacterium]|nr:LptA/OstA family protein [Steroidobacteraceae bacterium]
MPAPRAVPAPRAGAGSLLAALGCASFALGGAAAPPRAPEQLPVQVVAKHTDVDYRNHETVLTDATITQGDRSIRADRVVGKADGLDFRDSRWVFTGNVQMRAQQAASSGVLSSDRTTVDFRNNVLVHAVATGQPAHFEQTASDTGVLARAHADTIDYEVPAATLRLTTDAWLLYGTTEVTAPEVVYNIAQQKMEGASGGASGERVHITIVPQPSTKPKGKP